MAADGDCLGLFQAIIYFVFYAPCKLCLNKYIDNSTVGHFSASIEVIWI